MIFAAGDEFEHEGVQYRVREGNRCPGDLVIEFCVVGWHRPAIAHTMILTSFKFQVEENNYGPNGQVKKGRGGWYLLDALKNACRYGWQCEAEKITNQRVEKALRDEAAASQLSLPV